ncbi:MAG: uncharacterized protein PWP44_1230 [Thermacetogenium sp.]|jgi:hypothetical protein|nr:uncharacterized protein [Thermacetogenium sp.]
MPRVKKVPKRICVACRQTKDKKELIRVVRTPDRAVEVDPTGKKSGRGAYICRNLNCLETALAGRHLQRALNTELPSEVIEGLKQMLMGESN